MLVAVITNPDYYNDDFIRKIEQIVAFVEFRLDFFKKIDFAFLRNFRLKFSCPVIFTLRKKSQGGNFLGSESERMGQIKKLLQLAPNYFDIEYDVDDYFSNEILNSFPQTKLICSYHNFNETPSDLDEILNLMRRKKFSINKIATKANSIKDAFRMMHFVSKNKQDSDLVGLCMGEFGLITRVFSPIIGNRLNYTCFPPEELTAPGQLTVNELFNDYCYRDLQAGQIYYQLLSVDSYINGDAKTPFICNKRNNGYIYFDLPVSLGDFNFILKMINYMPKYDVSIFDQKKRQSVILLRFFVGFFKNKET